MKIEKLAGNILRVTISRADFAMRNIDSLHLKVTSKAYRNLIHDIVAHAEHELGFDVQDGNLLIETRPGKRTGEYIVTVKGAEAPYVSRDAEQKSFVDMLLKSVRDSMANPEKAADIMSARDEQDLTVPGDVNETGLAKPDTGDQLPVSSVIDAQELEKFGSSKTNMYDFYDIICFPDFEDLMSFCRSFTEPVKVASALYSYNDMYYLVLKLTKKSMSFVNNIESRAIEFGGYFLPPEFLLPILQEHGIAVLRRAAIKTVGNDFKDSK